MKLTHIFLSVILALGILTGCSSAPAEPTLNPTQGAQLLAGNYATTISSDDLARITSLDPGYSNNKGNWAIKFTDAGKFNAEKDGQFMAAGDFTVKGDQIEVYVKSVCTNCGCDQAIGRFNWALKDNRLAFVKIAGVCDAMDLILTAHALARQP